MEEESTIDKISTTFSPTKSSLETLQRQSDELILSQRFGHMQSIINANSSRACQVNKVIVEGTEQIRDDLIVAHLQPVIQAHSVMELMKAVDVMNDTLRSCGAAKDVIIGLDAVENGSTVLDIRPKVKLVPVNKFMAKTGTNIGNGEGDGYMTFQWRNIFGGGENFILDATTGTRTRSSYLVDFNAPLLNSTRWRWDTAAYATSRRVDWSSHEQVLHGVKSKIVKDVDGVRHELGVQSVLRSVRPYVDASSTILAHAGDDLKISVGYDASVDTRDDRVLPTDGWHVGVKNELAGGPFSTASFLKQTLEGSYAMNSGMNIVNFSLRGGWLYSKNSHVMDRFFLGGPNDVRGFFYNGLGARDLGDALGGDVFLSGGISGFTKFPFVSKDSGLKLHSFVNFGSLVPWDHTEQVRSLLAELVRPSVGCGFGVVFKHPVARFELNFVLPVVAHRNDAMRKGLQYGIGLEFM